MFWRGGDALKYLGMMRNHDSSSQKAFQNSCTNQCWEQIRERRWKMVNWSKVVMMKVIRVKYDTFQFFFPCLLTFLLLYLLSFWSYILCNLFKSNTLALSLTVYSLLYNFTEFYILIIIILSLQFLNEFLKSMTTLCLFIFLSLYFIFEIFCSQLLYVFYVIPVSKILKDLNLFLFVLIFIRGLFPCFFG